MRLIDADALKEYISDSFDLAIIDKAPTVDAEPINHGMWIGLINKDRVALCSNCMKGTKLVYQEFNGTVHRYNYLYCPHCGAKMYKQTEE